MKIKSIARVKKLAGQKVLLRVDFNVPLKDRRVKDDNKIVCSLETIKLLSVRKAKVVIISHLGDPVKLDPNFSLAPIAKHLAKLLDRKIKFIPETVGEKVDKAIAKMEEGEIIVLENTRYNEGELENDKVFAKRLTKNIDLYVNDAFAVSHRAQASVSAVMDYLPSYAGLLLEKELKALSKVITPKRPFVVVMGGAKIKTKAPLIANLYSKSNQILLGGGLANNFLKFKKLEIGKSLFDEDSLPAIKKLLKGKLNDKKIVLPIDVVVKDAKGKITAKKVNEISRSDSILDIGPETVSLFSTYIKNAKTIIWNGPMGKYEEEHFKNGTLSIARLIAARSTGRAFGLVGGGETVEALKLSGMTEYVDWVSTAGGAMLAFLGGDKMPGLKKIIS